MAEITASLVKELRERTGAGMMDCKKALTEANGDIELAIENMRKSGAIKAAKKAGNVAADGVIITKIDGNYGIILEVNCQTDFVAKDGGFQAFANKVLDAAVAGKITDVEVLKAQFEEERVALVAKIGENINIRRVSSLEGDVLGSYQHGARIGVLVAAKGADEELVKQLAMHIAASKPEFVKPEDRDREAEQGEGADKLILPFIAVDPGQHAHGNANHQGKAEGQNAQLHRGREHLFQLLGNQLSVNAGHAEIPVQQPVKPEEPGIPQGRPLERGVGREIAQAEADKVQEKERHQQQKEPT